MAEDVVLKVYIPKGEHLGKPLAQFVEGKGDKWSRIFTGQSEPIPFGTEDGKCVSVLPVTYRPKEVGRELPDANWVITTKDKIADHLNEKRRLDIYSDEEIGAYLAAEGFKVLRGLEYNPCLIGAATSNPGDWRAIDPMDVFTGHPFVVFRDVEREHDPNGPSTDVTINFRQQSLYSASIGSKNGGTPQRIAINYILGSEESHADGSPNRVIIPVIQSGNSIADASRLLGKMGKPPLRIQEFLYFSEPVILVRQETAEQYPHVVARFDDLADGIIRRGKRLYPHFFEPPGVIAAYSPQFIDFMNKHYTVGSPERDELLRRLGLPLNFGAAAPVACYVH